MNRPLITYITVVWNAVDQIEGTVESILPYMSDKVEYIVIDGCSQDGTVEKLISYEGKISGWLSEPDLGIYDAMNKGLRIAKGEFVCFINIGDQLLTCPLKQIELASRVNAAAISFPVQLSNGKVFQPSYSGKLKLENTLHHQGTYYRKTEVGEYDISFRTFADFDINQNLYKSRAKVLIDSSIVNSYHSLEGLSNRKGSFNEIFKVVNKNYGALYSVSSYLYFKLKYGLKNRFRLSIVI